MTLTYPVLPFCNTQVARTKLWDESSAIAPLRWISSLSSSGLGTPNIKEIVNIIGHVQSATSKAQWKLVSRFGLHEFSLHWCECFCSSYIARRLHWGASLPCPSLKPCFRWVFPMFVSAIRMCSRCRGGDKCSQTNIEFRFVVLQKRGETSLHMCADLQVSSCPPEMNLFWRRLFSEKNVLNAQKTASNGLPFQRLMFGCCGVYPTPGWYQELRFSARYQTMNQRHRAAATVVFWIWFSLFWMVSLDSNLSLKLRDCYHGMNGTVFPI